MVKRILGLRNSNRVELLANTTSAEKAACRILDAMSIKYIKQFPINTGARQYYADIYIPAIHLVLEIDGGYHYTDKQKRLDTNRSAGIRRLGYHVCRLSNSDARKPEKIRMKIKRYLKR